ncbi:response regulator transcription factor, partial [Chloroflexota bacterium]
FSDVPIIILTVRAEEADIVRGLEWGADDYIVKPFRQLELMSRIRALTRRSSSLDEETPLVCGPLSFAPSIRQLHYEQRDISLTRTESSIFHQLIRNAGNVVPHSSLAEAVWGEDYPDAIDSLRVYIRRLREKLEVDPSNPQIILTKAGIGYSLEKPN